MFYLKRFCSNPDTTCNSYLCYAAIPNGVKSQIDPHANGWDPYGINLYHLSNEEKAKLIRNFIANKRKKCLELAAIPHPAEFDKYFNL